jgi:hypothetical protein
MKQEKSVKNASKLAVKSAIRAGEATMDEVDEAALRELPRFAKRTGY